MRKPTLWFLTWSRTNLDVQPWKTVYDLENGKIVLTKVQKQRWKNCTIPVAKTKALTNFATEILILQACF